MRHCRQIIAAVICMGLVPPAVAMADSGGVEFFERRIRPLLVEHCYECHGPDLQENGLRLDQAGSLFAGGTSGKAIVPGKPEASLLVTAVQYVSTDLQMPPAGKLPAAEIANLVRWVRMGAPHPDGTRGAGASVQSSPNWKTRRRHWAFRPPKAVALPAVAISQWPQSSLDRFILAELEAASLAPSPPADRRTWLRRATFDLIGLPPTPGEVEAFLNDDSPQAFAAVVDRLLASPHYGERWGRHWLDVARYADSNGLDENLAHGNAWRYRDWVIEAINRDMPYDQFLRQQLAGDLLPAEDPLQRNGQLIATGFLTLGPKVLAEVDEQKMEMDIIDEQVDTFGRALLGLTLGCARCHDHKFDPITTRDYYSLAGIFKSTHTMDSFTKIARWHEHVLHDDAHQRAKREHAQQLEAKQEQLTALLAKATVTLQQQLDPAAPLPKNPEESFPPETRRQLEALRKDVAELEKQAPQPPTAMGVREGDPVEVAVHVRGSHLTLGEVVSRGIPEVLQGESSLPIDPQSSGRLQLADWITSPTNPLTARVMVNRVWRWHFGRGLVETPDNLGLTGAAPSNQNLLNHLAINFSRDWSLKNLHRAIMLSATYRTGSHCSDAAIEVDPENRLFGRFDLRRLEAEEIRDAMLAVSGSLDRTRGGPALDIENRKHIFDHTSQDATRYSTHRRSVYLPVVRNHLHESFTLFDYTDASMPTGDRATSTVPSQALYLLNSEFVQEASLRLADSLSGQPQNQRIEALYERAYARPATAAELARAAAFLERVQQHVSPDQAWQLLCHNVLISSEFFYIR